MSELLPLFTPTGESITEPFTVENYPTILEKFVFLETDTLHQTIYDFIGKYEKHPSVQRKLTELRLSLARDDLRHNYETTIHALIGDLQMKAYKGKTITAEDRLFLKDELQPHFRRAFAARLYHYMQNEPDDVHFRALFHSLRFMRSMDPEGFQRFKPVLRHLFTHHLPVDAYENPYHYVENVHLDSSIGFKTVKVQFAALVHDLDLVGQRLSIGKFKYMPSRGMIPDYYQFFPEELPTPLSKLSTPSSKLSSGIKAVGGGDLFKTGGAALQREATSGGGSSSWASVARGREPVPLQVQPQPAEDLKTQEMSVHLERSENDFLTGGAARGAAAQELTAGIQDLKISEPLKKEQMTWAERLKRGP